MEFTEEQLRILRHMLGITDPSAREPKPYRNYYCASPGDKALYDLQSMGAVVMYSAHWGHEWFECTESGKAAAIESFKTIRLPLSKRRYLRFLDLRDVVPDLTFHEFLTSKEFEQDRLTA